jgi:threonine/homoserine/homoserine lactone efflux protein
VAWNKGKQMAYEPIRPVDNYTDAFLTTLGVTLFMAFWVIAAVLGYLWVAMTAYGLNHFFKWIGRIRAS